MATINPYKSVNWTTVQEICSISHAHCLYQTHFDRLYNGGVRHMAISNYHPSKAWYPLENYFSFPIPSDVVQCPNAEHWKMSYYGDRQGTSSIHINGIGSTYQSDNDEAPWGCNFDDMAETFKKILNGLLYEDGGGLTINHPTWTRLNGGDQCLTIERMCKILDMDSRVLGIEFYNDSVEHGGEVTGYALSDWDNVLKTGRRAWGFMVPDWYHTNDPDWKGRNILLVSEKTEHECLKAYREGRFFGRLKNTDLSFTGVTVSGHTINVKTNHATRIESVIDGDRTEHTGDEITITVPTTATYARFEGFDSNDRIFTNPIIFKPKGNNKKSWFKKML